jgi:hypothetical protein
VVLALSCMCVFVIYPSVSWVLTFCGVTFFSGFLSSGVYFVSQSWCGVSQLLMGVFVCLGVSVCRVLSRFSCMTLQSEFKWIL